MASAITSRRYSASLNPSCKRSHACAGGLSSSDGGRASEAGGSFRPECNGDAAEGEGDGEGYSAARQGLAGWQWARGRPLVAFSLGSYGAALADGSEFTGAYATRVTEEQLLDFHRARIQVLYPARHTACPHTLQDSVA